MFMKKILAILCGATMMFAACTPGGETPRPVFPETSSFDILSGRAQKLEFTAEKDWTLSLDYDYAYISAAGNSVKTLSGVAGEKTEVFVGVEEAIENYDSDIVFHVNMEMEGYSQVLATFTIKKLEYKVQEYEIESGMMRSLKFRATEAWTIALESDYAYLQKDGEKNDSFSGQATGELVTIRVCTEDNIKNYDEDINFTVTRKMGAADAQDWAKFTIKKIERPAAISLPNSDPDVTFEEGGHPNWSPFKSAQHTYHMNYASEWVIGGIRLDCGLETDYSIKTYAYTEGASDPVDFTTREDSWLTITDGLGENGKGFMVAMDLSKESAQWSWFDTQYESYVNFEDAEGNVLVSIFCTSTYKPGQTGGEASMVSLISEYASMAGISLTGSGNQYTLTFSDPMAFEPSMKNMAGFKIENCGQINFENEGYGILKLNKVEDTDSGLGTYYYISFTEAVTDPYAIDIRECPINAFTSDWSAQYTINVVLGWVEGGSTTGGEVTINEMASQLGVILEELTTSDADYDADWGIEKQYRLTYNSMAAFTMPSYASLTIPGFAMGTPMGSINGVQAYEMFLFSLDQESGQVLLAPNTESGYSAENIPNGKVDLICYNAQYDPIVRIVLVINVAQ